MVVTLHEGIPPRFKDAQLEGLDEKLKVAVHEDANFFFVGPFGTGKTWAMAAAARFWLPRVREAMGPLPYREYGPSVEEFIWTTESALWAKVRSTWSNRKGVSEAYLSQLITECRFLCIDDIGKGAHAAPDSYKSFLYNLVNCRYVAHRKTFLTSNLDAEEMVRLCAAAVDRLREMCVVIEMTGDSRRKPTGKLVIQPSQKTGSRASKRTGPVQSTGEPVEAPSGAVQAALTTNSGVQVGDGTGADEDIPF